MSDFVDLLQLHDQWLEVFDKEADVECIGDVVQSDGKSQQAQDYGFA